jgi:hypothetical protein
MFCIIIFIAIFVGMHVHANSDLAKKLTLHFNKQELSCVFVILDATPHPTSKNIL